MPPVADYVVVSDKSITLQTGGDIDTEFTFGLPDKLVQDQAGILTLQVAQSSQGRLKWNFEINGQPVATPRTRGTFFTAVQEVINSGILKPSANSAKLEILEGEGALSVSDVVVLFQRNT